MKNRAVLRIMLVAACAVVSLATVLACGCGGGGAIIVATDGETYPLETASIARPALGSAAHDLSCPREKLRVILQPFTGGQQADGVYIVEGCGGRATYMVVYAEGRYHLVLIAKVPIDAPAPFGTRDR